MNANCTALYNVRPVFPASIPFALALELDASEFLSPGT